MLKINYCFGRRVSAGNFMVSDLIGTLLFLDGNWLVIFAEPAVPLALVWSSGLAVMGMGLLQEIRQRNINPGIYKDLFFI
jgi:hypothetical protein